MAGVHRIVDMPQRTVQLLHRFVEQSDGRLSKRARNDEFAALTDDDVTRIEQMYQECFRDDAART